MSLKDLPRRHEEIDPPHAEGESHARDAGEHRIQCPALPVDHGGECRYRADDALAEGDDGKEAMALGNVMRVPGRAAGLTLGEHGACHLDEYQDAAEHDGAGGCERSDDLHHPADLRDRDGGGISEAYPAPGGIRSSGTQPLKHECHAHDHVAEHHHGIVQVPGALDRSEHARHTGGEYQHADHLHHRHDPEQPVVGVVG